MKRASAGSFYAAVLTVCLLFFYYSFQIIHANKIAFGEGGDGYKNYYTLAYFLKHDSGSHFSGMNYPYGENVIFTDNQPAVAWALKFLCRLFPAFTNHIHAFLTWAIFASIVFTAVIICSILMELELSIIPAVLFAVCIAMLSPQLPRLNAHFSLGYSFYIPLLLWLLIRYFKSDGALRYAALLCLLITFFTFIHIYYLAMALFFMLALALLVLLVNLKQAPQYFKFAGLLAVSAIAPFIILKLYLLFTDFVTDRPQNPWGYFDYCSTWCDIFLHDYSFTGEIAPRFVTVIHHGEGMGYIGLAATVMLLAGLFILMVKIRSAKELLKRLGPVSFFMLPAIAVLMFAMAIPFKWPGFRGAYNHLPLAMKQFRAAGRFNWIFYYTATITASVIYYNIYLYILGRRRWLAYLFMALICTVWFIEVNMISVRYRKEFDNNGGMLDEQSQQHELLGALSRAGRSVDDFQAIIAFPFFLNGSEKIYLESPSSFDAMLASLCTGLPVAHGSMSRTSLSQTLKMANLLSSALIHKDVIELYNNKKPLLLLTASSHLKPSENDLAAKGRFLFRWNNDNFYELPLSAFADTIDRARNYLRAWRSSLFSHDGYYSNIKASDVVVKRFEDEPKDYAVFGKGAHFDNSGNPYLYIDTLPGAADSSKYEFSIWLYADKGTASFPDIFLTQNDTAERTLETLKATGSFATNNYQMWERVDIPFMLYGKTNKIYISGAGNYATYDELMIRPVNENVVIDLGVDSLYSLNNYPVSMGNEHGSQLR